MVRMLALWAAIFLGANVLAAVGYMLTGFYLRVGLAGSLDETWPPAGMSPKMAAGIHEHFADATATFLVYATLTVWLLVLIGRRLGNEGSEERYCGIEPPLRERGVHKMGIWSALLLFGLLAVFPTIFLIFVAVLLLFVASLEPPNLQFAEENDGPTAPRSEPTGKKGVLATILLVVGFLGVALAFSLIELGLIASIPDGVYAAVGEEPEAMSRFILEFMHDFVPLFVVALGGAIFRRHVVKALAPSQPAAADGPPAAS